MVLALVMPQSQLTRGVFACLLRGVAFDLVPRIEKNEGDPRLFTYTAGYRVSFNAALKPGAAFDHARGPERPERNPPAARSCLHGGRITNPFPTQWIYRDGTVNERHHINT